jgi:hypothetical protein
MKAGSSSPAIQRIPGTAPLLITSESWCFPAADASLLSRARQGQPPPDRIWSVSVIRTPSNPFRLDSGHTGKLILGKQKAGMSAEEGKPDWNSTIPGQINSLWPPCLADVDDDTVLEFREQYAPENTGVKYRMPKTAAQVAQPQWVTRSTSGTHRGPSVDPPGQRRLGTQHMMRARAGRKCLERRSGILTSDSKSECYGTRVEALPAYSRGETAVGCRAGPEGGCTFGSYVVHAIGDTKHRISARMAKLP